MKRALDFSSGERRSDRIILKDSGWGKKRCCFMTSLHQVVQLVKKNQLV